MQTAQSMQKEAIEDIFFGQIVLIWARWFIITAVAILALLSAVDVPELIFATLFVVALMSVNFFVHGRYVTERPSNQLLLLVLSLVDLLVITGLVAFWTGASAFASPYYIFYYPILIAFAFVFRPRLTALYTLITLAAYAITIAVLQPGVLSSSVDLEAMVIRLITMASVGGLATYFWRIQRDRRRAVIANGPEREPAS